MLFPWLHREPTLNPQQQAILRSALFSGLTPSEILIIDPIFHERTYVPGEIIFEEGDEGQGMFLILEGLVRISRRTSEGPRELAQLRPGEFFGELALIESLPRVATATAAEPSRLLGFFRTDFINLLEENRKIGIKISLALARHNAKRMRQSLLGEATHSSV
jgi:CRP-like cAMP-binding protein